jgi:hypothetical protein
VPPLLPARLPLAFLAQATETMRPEHTGRPSEATPLEDLPSFLSGESDRAPSEPQPQKARHSDGFRRTGWRAYVTCHPPPDIKHAFYCLLGRHHRSWSAQPRRRRPRPRTAALARGPQGSPYGAAREYRALTPFCRGGRPSDLRKRRRSIPPRRNRSLARGGGCIPPSGIDRVGQEDHRDTRMHLRKSCVWW